MAEESGQEKTETPSDKKREDARKEGQVAISREVGSAAMLGAFSLYFMMMGSVTVDQYKTIWKHALTTLILPQDLNPDMVQKLFVDTIVLVAPLLMGVFGIALVVGLMAGYFQVGMMMTPLKFNFSRIDPIAGTGRLFSGQALAELAKNLFKLFVIGYITFSSLEQSVMEILTLSRLKPEAIMSYNFSLVGSMFGRVSVALAILAIMDLLYQRWALDQKLMMTKQEVKEEMKESEGDPQIKARVRQAMREMSRARMMQSVPKADVVVTNPTHYAVALQYDREIMGAPRMIAKGADHVALRIREVARENNVPIVENPPVAREIYASVDIGHEIPDHMFRAVAEILAYVYKLKKKKI